MDQDLVDDLIGSLKKAKTIARRDPEVLTPPQAR